MSICCTLAGLNLLGHIRLLLCQSVCCLNTQGEWMCQEHVLGVGKEAYKLHSIWLCRKAAWGTFVVRSSMKLALDRLLSMDACLLASAAASLACRRQNRV